MERLPKDPGGNNKKERSERAKVLLKEAEERLKKLEALPESVESLKAIVLTLKTIIMMREVLQNNPPSSNN